MFKEKFPVDKELKPELVRVAQELEVLKGDRVTETEIDQDGVVKITFESGKKLFFGIIDEDHLKVNNISIES